MTVAASDYLQVGTVAHRLTAVLGRLFPRTLVRSLRPTLTPAPEPPGADPAGLRTRADATRSADAGHHRADAPPADRAALDAALAAAASPLERQYLEKAVAAGHDAPVITAFADRIRGRTPAWLRHHLTIVDPARPGRVTHDGVPFAQTDGTTCGTTAVLLTRVLTDPVYALALTTGTDPEAGDPGQEGPDPSDPDEPARPDAFGQRLAAEQQRIHRVTNTAWPQALGTSPWGMRRGLAREAGARYGFRWTDDTDRRVLAAATRDALAAVDAGHPVPLLVGNVYPAHYLLIVAHDEDHVLIYNPAGGRLAEVAVTDLRAGNLAAVTAFRHLHGVLLPDPAADPGTGTGTRPGPGSEPA